MAQMTGSTGYDGRSSGSKLRSLRTNRCLASALARRCWRERSAQECSVTTKSVARLAITRSSLRSLATGCARPRFRDGLQWHSDGFDLPQGAELLAVGGANFRN